ncbi:MAG TPA: universal stress protein, partial [Edaphobacter sp.]|uniref:universal stress protein n=1 Tax=Edaphobacter sp. TaxID=1934404 RepID=UPI002CD390B4
RLVLGSVAESILRKVGRPVLIVGPNCAAKQDPFRSILLATDLETTGSGPVQYARALASCAASNHLTLLHVIEKNPHVPGLDPELFENSLRQELRRLLPADSGLSCRPKILLEHGTPAEVILEIAKKEVASLVIVGLRHQAALSDHVPWSTLSHILRDAKCSVLVINNSLD